MKSSKSKRLIHDYNELENIFGAEHILVMKPSIDTRSDKITSRHLNQELDCYVMDDDWKERVKLNEAIIMVDEFQFLSENAIEWLIHENQHYSMLMLYGLDKDYTGNYFPAYSKAKKWCDKEEVLYAMCDCCGKHNATHSKLIRGVGDESHILIGDEAYSPRCTDCLTKRIN